MKLSEIGSLVSRDSITILGLGILSLVVALFINQLRAAPLSLVYQSKKVRLLGSVEQLSVTGGPTNESSEKIISLDRMKRIVEESEALVIDTRPALFYELGHIPEAISLPRDNFKAGYQNIRTQLEHNKSQRIVVYCSSLSCEDSGLVAEALNKLGYTNVWIFKQGWSAWQKANLTESRSQ
ncbi:MAG: rhodanese-like domain-containing protein [Verrucomicrobiota bacterium]